MDRHIYGHLPSHMTDALQSAFLPRAGRAGRAPAELSRVTLGRQRVGDELVCVWHGEQWCDGTSELVILIWTLKWTQWLVRLTRHLAEWFIPLWTDLPPCESVPEYLYIIYKHLVIWVSLIPQRQNNIIADYRFPSRIPGKLVSKVTPTSEVTKLLHPEEGSCKSCCYKLNNTTNNKRRLQASTKERKKTPPLEEKKNINK